jgi:sugar phosphate permease
MRSRLHWKARHTVLAILGVTWIATYLERTVMAVAMPYIAADYNLNAMSTGLVLGVFYAGYAVFQVPGGLLADLFGVRVVATVAIVWRAIFVALTAAVSGLTQLIAVRVLFGLGDGLFPASAIKTIAIWFPKRERTRANALMLAVMPFGTALAPLAMIPIVMHWGWRAAFYSLLIPGALTALIFWIFVRNRPSESRRVSAEECCEIETENDAAGRSALTKADFWAILKRPDVVKYFLAVLAYDTAYWGYWSWLPSYLVNARGFSMAEMGMAASLPSFGGVLGCLVGGWVSDKYFVNQRRLPIISVQLISAVLLFLTFSADTATKMVIYQTIGGFFLEAFFSTFWALPMTTVPGNLMGVTSGFINMAGQIAAFLSPIVIGFLVDAGGGGYGLTFAFLISSILVSSLIVFSVSRQPRLQPVERHS